MPSKRARKTPSQPISDIEKKDKNIIKKEDDSDSPLKLTEEIEEEKK